MRLQNCVPPLTDEAVQLFRSAGVNTDADLLLAGDPINIFTKLPPGHGISLTTFNNMVAQISEVSAATPVYGDTLLQQEVRQREEVLADDILTGIPELDALLETLKPPHVIELSGDTGSGKTVGGVVFLCRYVLNMCRGLHFI